MMGESINPVMQEINALKKEREVTLRNERLSQLTGELKLTNNGGWILKRHGTCNFETW
jgi:hypothetical protein